MQADALQTKFEELMAEEEERPAEDDAENDLDDAVFAQSFIPRSLAEVHPGLSVVSCRVAVACAIV